jgi:tetratricopeptide (TPR) repeat protein
VRTLCVLVAAGLLTLSAAVQAAWYGAAEQTEPLPAVRYLRSPEAARRLALSYDLLLADLYWMRALQEFGSTRLREHGPKTYDDLYPFLDLTTSLDPRFNIAYRFGAIFLSDAPPGGPGRPDLAIALLEKGIAHNPHRWEYYQDIGFVHYWWTGDYTEAAAWFDRGAQVPGAPWWLQSLAATTLAAGGDLRHSRFLWQMLRDTADNDWLRNDAARRLRQLDAMERIEVLSAGVARARRLGIGAPWTWALLFERGLITTVPVDPDGVPYVIDMTTGAIDVSRDSPLWPLPAPLGRAPGADSEPETRPLEGVL